jgi:hypothetical protein
LLSLSFPQACRAMEDEGDISAQLAPDHALACHMDRDDTPAPPLQGFRDVIHELSQAVEGECPWTPQRIPLAT